MERFVEKPDYDTAVKYVERGDYMWNSGIFIWKISTILNAK
nr:sugar phosphate nucleotidyltransferase [Thermoanaerobacterium sp. RBIITD]